MVKIKEHKIETFKIPVSVCRKDIDDGKCRNPSSCMEKLAIFRGATELLGEGKIDRLRLDGAQIKFNYNGYRWYSTTPKTAKLNLIKFDAWARKRIGPCPVAPHKFTVVAIKGTKILKISAERQHQVNLARKARKDAGTPDKKGTGQTLSQRVIGLGAV